MLPLFHIQVALTRSRLPELRICPLIQVLMFPGSSMQFPKVFYPPTSALHLVPFVSTSVYIFYPATNFSSIFLPMTSDSIFLYPCVHSLTAAFYPPMAITQFVFLPTDGIFPVWSHRLNFVVVICRWYVDPPTTTTTTTSTG